MEFVSSFYVLSVNLSEIFATYIFTGPIKLSPTVDVMEAGVRIVWSVARIMLLPVSRHHDPGQTNPAPGIIRNGHLGPREGRGLLSGPS